MAVRDITLGQYYPGSSWIHRLDPRVKILATILYIVALFVVQDFIGFAIATAGLAVVVIISKVPLELYTQRSEADIPDSGIHHDNQHVHDKRRGAGFLLGSGDNQGGAQDCRIHGCKAHTAGDRLIASDVDHQADKPDGRHRSAAVAFR